MRLRYSKQARNDLSAIASYLRPRNPDAARRVKQTIQETAKFLLSFPEAGRKQQARGVRKAVTTRYGYLIYYRFDRTSGWLDILSIRHSRQEREFDDA